MLRREPGWSFEWLPSHRTQAEALAASLSQDEWLGNETPGGAAKAQPRAIDICPLLLARWAENQTAVEAVWRLIAESQVTHLAGRPRRSDGSAVRARKRKAPARPGRNTRKRQQPQQQPQAATAAAPAAAADARPAVADSCRRRTAELAKAWPVLPAVA